MSLVAYADSDDDSSDSESSDAVPLSVAGPERNDSNEMEPVLFDGPTVLGQ